MRHVQQLRTLLDASEMHSGQHAIVFRAGDLFASQLHAGQLALFYLPVNKLLHHPVSGFTPVA